MTARRQHGLLHDDRPAGRRHRHERRSLPGRRRLDEPGAGDHGSRPEPAAPATPTPANRSSAGTSPRAARTTAASSSRPEGRASRGTTAPPTSSARSCSTAPATAPRTRRTSTSSSRARRRITSAKSIPAIGKPPPAPPAHPVISTNFITGLGGPEGLAVDQETGAIYVAETGSGGRIARFDASGAPLKFPEGPGAGTNRIPNSGHERIRIGIAVDSSGGVLDGAIYAIHGLQRGRRLLEERRQARRTHRVRRGLRRRRQPGNRRTDRRRPRLRRHVPLHAAESTSTPVSNANYTETSIKTEGMEPCHVGVDTAGHAFAQSFSFGAGTAEEVRHLRLRRLAADRGRDRSRRHEPRRLERSRHRRPLQRRRKRDRRLRLRGQRIATIGSSASLGSNSNGVAVNAETKETFALNGSNVVKFGYEVVPYEPIDNPAVIHGVSDAAVHSFGDFQVTPDGRYALFSSPVPLTGYQTLGHSEIYRYDAQSDTLACASCAPTGAVGNSDVKLSPHGLNLADDGRVFFTTPSRSSSATRTRRRTSTSGTNGKVGPDLDRDRPGRLGAGHRLGGRQGRLLLHPRHPRPEDENGNVVKIYDARERRRLPLRSRRAASARPPTSATAPAARRRRRPRSTPGTGPAKAGRRPTRAPSCKKPKVQEARQVREEGAQAQEAQAPQAGRRRARTMRSRSTMVSLRRLAAIAAVARPSRSSRRGLAQAECRSISEFSVGSSNQQAGGHPDLTARFKLDEPGEPEVAQERRRQPARRASSATRARSSAAAPRTSSLNECPPGSQVGLITIIANYEGDPEHRARHGADLQHAGPRRRNGAARLRRRRPSTSRSSIPIDGPHRLRLRAAHHRSRDHPDRRRSPRPTDHDLGLPGRSRTRRRTLPPGAPGSPPGCPGSPTRAAPEAPFPHAGADRAPVHRQPERLHRAAAAGLASTSPPTRTRPSRPRDRPTYPATTGCEDQSFDPVLNVGLTTDEADSPSGLDLQLKADQFLGRAGALAVDPALGDRDPARRASRSTPTPPTARPPAPTRRPLRHDRPRRTAPTTQDRHRRSPARRRSTARCVGSLYIGEPKPGRPVPALHDRRRLRDPRQARRLGPPGSRRPGS